MYDPTANLPRREYYTNLEQLVSAPHVLIAGATGSGKSVFVNSLLYSITALKKPSTASLVLIDPKRVELCQWRDTAFCVGYADRPDTALELLSRVDATMERRYTEMQAAGQVMYNGSDIYVVIDELADLLLLYPREFIVPLQHIAQLGRAAKIHLIACTQSPSRKTLPAAIILNMTHRIALRCDSAIESRQIIGQPGAELLPQYGFAILKAPGEIKNLQIPMTAPEKLKERQEMFYYPMTVRKNTAPRPTFWARLRAILGI